MTNEFTLKLKDMQMAKYFKGYITVHIPWIAELLFASPIEMGGTLKGHGRTFTVAYIESLKIHMDRACNKFTY